MPRRLRVSMGGYSYHVLNRAVGRMRIFGKERDFEAFERVLAEGLAAWPVKRSRNWVAWVNRGLKDEQLDAVRTCVERGRPFGSESWVRRTAARLGLDFTLHGPGRPRKLSHNQ